MNVRVGNFAPSESTDQTSLETGPKREVRALPAESLAGAAHEQIRRTLIREIEAMVLFALGSGIGLSGEILRRVEHALPGGGQADAAARRDPAFREPRADSKAFESTSGGVATPALADGQSMASADGTPAAAQDELASLADIHWDLTKLVAPAQPSTLVLLRDEQRHHPVRYSLGAVGLVRKMFVIALLSLMVLLAIALTPEVSTRNISKGLLSLQGYPLLVNEIFLVAAAAIGATLANLKQLDRYVSACMYDSRYQSSYWTRVVMGIISGVVLSQLVYGVLSNSSQAASGGGDLNGFFDIGEPLLALLGGFSVDLVHDVLSQFISIIRNALGGAKSPISSAKERTAGGMQGRP